VEQGSSSMFTRGLPRSIDYTRGLLCTQELSLGSDSIQISSGPLYSGADVQYVNLRETLIGQVGSTTKFLACTGDFPFPNIVRDLDYSDGGSCIMIFSPSKEMLV